MYLDDFLDSLIIEKKLSKNTYKSYKNDLDKYINYLKSKRIDNINDITQKDIESFIKYLNKENLNSKTIAHNITCIKEYHKYLIKAGLIKINVKIYRVPN